MGAAQHRGAPAERIVVFGGFGKRWKLVARYYDTSTRTWHWKRLDNESR